jgi:thiamine biosynthesis lipoprotein ApbE
LALLSSDSFKAIGTMNTVVVGEASALPEAMAIVQAEIQEIDRVCSRFRDDSELSRLNERSGDGEVELSPLLEEAIVAALRSAEMTDGLVDPTVGRFVQEMGYTVTFKDLPADGPPIELRVQKVIGWRALAYDPAAHTVRIPAGVSLDLGASGKAWAADRSAEIVTGKLGVAVAVECGGDIAVRGPLPKEGWPMRVSADADTDPGQTVMVFDGGLATSGTTMRRWRRGGVELHHIIDPSTGLPARTPWSMVSVAAATCVEANAAATAAVILGDRATDWLNERKLPARLVDRDGQVSYAGGWPSS